MIARGKEHVSRVVATVCMVLGICAVARAQSVDGFNPGANDSVYAIAVQPDGKILVGGAFTMLGGGGTGTTTRNFLGRLNADGSLDTSFNPGANGYVNAVAVQSDGKILVGGSFTTLGGGGTGTTPRNYLGRLNADGSLDTSFNPGMDSSVSGVAVQADGKILVSGNFTTLGGGGTGTTPRHFLGRLNADGSLDTTFDPGANYFVHAMAVQPDGKVLVGGWFTMLGGGGNGTTPRDFIGRLNPDGSLDTSFNPGANNYVTSFALQPDGKILAGGSFTTLGGGGTGTTTRNRLGRLNADGSLDPTFNPGANDAVRALNLQLDGKVVIVGSFTGLGGGTGTTPRHNLGRINADGSLDTSFDPGANGFWVFGLAMQPDGKILAGGDFVMLGGGGTGTTSRAHIGRVTNSSAAIQSIDITNGGSTITWSRSGAGPEVSSVTFESSTDAATYTPLGNGTRVAGGWQLSGLNLPADQSLYVRARGYYATNGWFSGSGSIFESIRRVYTSCSAITLSATVFANGTSGEAYPPTTITQTGGVGTTTFAVTSGALPDGMSLSSAGVVSGTPNAAGTFNATVTATDANGCTGSRAYTVTIAPACSSIASTGATFAAAGGSGSVAITAPAGCSWTVTNVPSWASTISGASGSGAGVWQYAVAANAGPLRSQTISAAGHGFELRQLAGSVVPYGVWEDFAWDSPTEVDFIIDKLVAAGVQNVRMAFRWYMIEPTNNQWDFGVHDQVLSKLRAKGIEILGLLEHPPNWATVDSSSFPVSDADWQDFVSHVADHFRGQVASWEVWNEENLVPSPNPVRYVQLLKVASVAIRSADPSAYVVLGAIAGNGVNQYWQGPLDQYLQKVYDNGGKDYFDIVNIHPYVHPVTLGVSVLQTFVQGTHTVMAANGDAGKPMWITEIGWTIDPAYLPPINETDQANWVTGVYNARASLGADRIYWYELHELYPPPTDVGWGLIRHDLSLRPSYFAYKNLTSSPPTVTGQPQSQSIASGHTGTMSVSATGTEPLTYQWYIGASGTTTNPIGGATGSSYTTPALTSTTSYWVRISNTNGTANSNTATMTVGTPPTITTQPQSQTIPTGQTASLSVVATGTGPLTYQWYAGASGTTTNPIAGATAITYTTPALTSSTSYWVRVSNGYSPAADSTTATITIGATLPTVTTSVASGIGAFGATLNGTVNPNGSSTTATFQYGLTTSYGNLVTGSLAPGSGTSVVAISAALTTLACNTPYHFRAAATNAAGPATGLDATFTTAACPPPTPLSIAPAFGPDLGGTAVTIVGIGFTSGATVAFGGVAAMVHAVTPTTITATTSRHLHGLVDIVVTNPDTQTGTLSNAFSYSTGAPPTITSLVPSSGSENGGTIVTVTGTNFLVGVTLSVGGAPATGVNLSAETTFTATTGAHAAGAVDIVVTNPDRKTGTLANGFTYVAPPTSGGGGGGGGGAAPAPTPAPTPTPQAPSAPGAPMNLTSSVSGSAVTLSWTASAATDAASAPTSYVIEAGSFSGGSDLANLSTGNVATSFTANPVAQGTFFVRVRAMNSVGTSPPSNEVVVRVGPVTPGTPGPPSGLVTSVSGSTITLAWSAPGSGGSPTSYVISAGSSPGLSNLASFSTGSAATSLSVGGVPAGTYFVRVQAANAFGNSAPSNEAVLVVGGSGPCSGPPSAPDGLSFTLSGSTATIAWNGSAGSPTSYVIEAGTFSGGTNIVVSDTGGTLTSLTATVSRGTYFVRVRGRNACGTSTPSNEVTIVVP